MSFTLHPDLQRDGIAMGSFPLCEVLLINDARLWTESRIFSKAIMAAFDGEKLNVAALGNMTPQLHIHHIVRYKSDAAWPGPIWGKQALKPYSDENISEIRARLKALDMNSFKPK